MHRSPIRSAGNRTIFGVVSIVLAMIIGSASVMAQYRFAASVRDAVTGEPLVGANVSVEGTYRGGVSDSAGTVRIDGVPPGNHVLVFSYMGYQTRRDTVAFPLLNDAIVTVHLWPEEEELEEVLITATRSSRTIEDSPTRVEAISGEELEEKANMRPGDIRMQLNESTGILVQQTSATSATATIRIQGLDGRYTQILRDGFPLYGGFAGGLSLLQVPPLDLRQIEVIKGSASTLYGGGAIAGLVNLVSREPSEKDEIALMANGTTARGLDLNGFSSRRQGKLGYTLFVAGQTQEAYDVDDNHFSDIPDIERLSVHPRLFLYPNRHTTMSLGLNLTQEKRLGGDMDFVEGRADSNHSFFERNKSRRASSQFNAERQRRGKPFLVLKNSVGYFSRSIAGPDIRFKGDQLSTFSEISVTVGDQGFQWVTGLNAWTERFDEENPEGIARDYTSTVLGGFVQHSWSLSDRFSTESGLRLDYVADDGALALPRVSLLYRSGDHWTVRLGGGLGYKTPTIFTEESERVSFVNVRPVDSKSAHVERSAGGNVDVNFRTLLGDRASVSVNQLFYYTRIRRALLPDPDSLASGIYLYRNQSGHIDSRGFETNARFGYGHWKFFAGYTYTAARREAAGQSASLPLVPRHRLGLVLIYEVERAYRAGFEAYYTGSQHRSDGTSTTDFWIFGFMAERRWGRWSAFANLENFTDTRQSRYETMVTGTHRAPQFREIYAPVEGFVMNGGVKVHF